MKVHNFINIFSFFQDSVENVSKKWKMLIIKMITKNDDVFDDADVYDTIKTNLNEKY